MNLFDCRHRSRDHASVHAAWGFAAFVLFLFALIALVPAARADSLWPADGQGARSMFADRKASAKGDILTIIVAESAVAQSSQNKSSNRESSLEDAVSRARDYVQEALRSAPGYGKGHGPLNHAHPLGVAK